MGEVFWEDDLPGRYLPSYRHQISNLITKVNIRARARTDTGSSLGFASPQHVTLNWSLYYLEPLLS